MNIIEQICINWMAGQTAAYRTECAQCKHAMGSHKEPTKLHCTNLTIETCPILPEELQVELTESRKG